ncbi:MAG: hypothetical protein O3B84_03110 [Chloroflexi bacterium]|nr:hypothetical protein [Chloroflexota bacterium]
MVDPSEVTRLMLAYHEAKKALDALGDKAEFAELKAAGQKAADAFQAYQRAMGRRK